MSNLISLSSQTLPYSTDLLRGITDFASAGIDNLQTTSFRLSLPAGGALLVTGVGFTYDQNGRPSGGTVAAVSFIRPDGASVRITFGSTFVVSQLYDFIEDAAGGESRWLDFLFAPGVEVRGLGAADLIEGGGGADTLWGDFRNDLAGAGADTLIGGLGNDQYIITTGLEQIVEAAGGGIDAILTTLNAYTLGANLENLRYIDSGNFHGIGNAGANLVQGFNGADTLDGGGGGADTLAGGNGNDVYIVRQAGVLVRELLDQGIDEVRTTLNNYTLDSEVENLTFIGAGNDFLAGNAGDDLLDGGTGLDQLYGEGGNDTLGGGTGNDYLDGGTDQDLLLGGAGADTLLGGEGADTLTGGTGRDRLDGGTGADVFRWEAAAEGGDTIAAFETGTDRLDLRSLLDLYGIGNLDFASLAGGEYLRATTDRAGNAVLLLDRDGSAGSAGPLTIATFAGLGTDALLQEGNFVLGG
ncbi:MAG: type I secretion C-terminal target domain-containing protein [Alphaproteobacteria bacterium]|nr:type I secretion C-terminal target domain-containing protein [Alphaproteobacteria bacterium]